MKATINGIEVEGTPQEIMEFKRISETVIPHQVAPYRVDPYRNPYESGTPWFGIFPPVITSTTTWSGEVGYKDAGHKYTMQNIQYFE